MTWTETALRRARAETPGTQQVVHLNNAGAALMPEPVRRAVSDHLDLEAEIGGYEAADREELRREAVYASIARLLGCAAQDIAQTDSASRSWQVALHAIPFQPGDRILTAPSEYVSNYLSMLRLRRQRGVEIEVIPTDVGGAISLEALEEALRRPARVVALTHVATSSGLVNPAAEVGRLAAGAGALYLLDACQSAGQLPLDVNELGCDMLTATGRKFLRGPRGTGFLYVRPGILGQLDPVYLDSRSAVWDDPTSYTLVPGARRFETWESSLALQLGVGAAVDYALSWGVEAIAARVGTLAEDLRQQLAGLPEVTVHDPGEKRCGIVTFSCARVDAESIRLRLLERRINVSVTTRDGALLDTLARQLPLMVRASPHYYNTEAEIDTLVAAVAEITA